jgi:DNA helicase-2/ATP-dependent DNA helicase PcrA
MMKSVVIYGPPGCGKSTEILRRMQEAIKSGVPQDRIGLVSFTRAAAHELARRAGVRPGRNISTIHSYAFRLTNTIREQVVNREKLREFSRESKIETTGAGVYDQEVLGPGDYYLAMYGYMRSLLWDDPKRAFYEGGREGSLAEFKYFIQAYEQWKAANGYVDFSDMLTNALREDPRDLGLDVLFLDEAQDFSLAQWKLIHHWVPHVREVVLALDDDQTLYKFNGAYPDGGAKFEERYGSERVVLRQSYRVPSSVHALATSLISHVSNRVEKEYLPREEVGRVRRFSDLVHVPDPDPEQETLILFRNHSMRAAIESWLMDRGVPYMTDNGRPGPLQGGHAAAVRAWLRAQSAYQATGNPMVEPRSWSAMRRHALAVHLRHFKAEEIEPIIGKPWQNVFGFPQDVRIYLRTLEAKYGTAFPQTKIHLSTIHGAKGREADRVILLDGMSGRTAESMTRDPDTEIRTFYVGVTRTRKELDIVTADNPISAIYMRAQEQEP